MLKRWRKGAFRSRVPVLALQQTEKMRSFCLALNEIRSSFLKYKGFFSTISFAYQIFSKQIISKIPYDFRSTAQNNAEHFHIKLLINLVRIQHLFDT